MRGYKDVMVEQRSDGTVAHHSMYEPGVNRVFMQHSDGVTYDRLERIDLTMGGGLYIDYRNTEITDPKWYHRPLYWLIDKL